MKAVNKKNILTFLVRLFHPSNSIDISSLSERQGFWDSLIKIGSSHLVLPAIFASFRRKKLESQVPKDLLSYLEKITELNIERNRNIYEQIIFLTKILREQEVDFVFIKGAALLILKPFNVLEERMIGDIDILVKESCISKAKKVLSENGFYVKKYKKAGFTTDIKEVSKRHLQRMINPNYIAAVELHISVLEHRNTKYLSSQQIFNDFKFIGQFPIPSSENLWKHAILNWQYNDRGLFNNQFSLRTLIDVIYLEPENFNHHLEKNPAIRHFYSLCSVFIDTYKDFHSFSSTTFNYKLHYPSFNHLMTLTTKFRFFIEIVLNRVYLIIKSDTYRRRVFKNPQLLLNKIFTFWRG